MRSLFGCCGLLFETDDVPVGVELGNTEPLGIRDAVQERAGAVLAVLELVRDVRKRGAAQDVVAEHAAERVVADEVAGEPDGVRDAKGTGLVAIRQIEPEGRAVASSSTTSPTLLPPTTTITSRMPIPARVSIG